MKDKLWVRIVRLVQWIITDYVLFVQGASLGGVFRAYE